MKYEDRDKIYRLTKRINNLLHFEFGIKDLSHRMVFTTCSLVVQKFGADLANQKEISYKDFCFLIHKKMCEILEVDHHPMLDALGDIRMNQTENEEAMNSFIETICEISEILNEDTWSGEDIMSIFFQEFNRYKKKSDLGQVFTPEHIASLMVRLIHVNKDNVIGDFCCGSGTFLVNTMSKTRVSNHQGLPYLFGIEFDRDVFSLAYANMLLHDKNRQCSSIVQMDARSEKAGEWISSNHITKVLMNPPYETKYGCIEIIKNVLDHVEKDALCAFILPDNKLEKTGVKKVADILNNHAITHIIKLPEKTFSKGAPTSIFIFKAGTPQEDHKIFGCFIEDDGLKTVKNHGRIDTDGSWQEIEDYWVSVIENEEDSKYNTVQWIDPKQRLSYKIPDKPFEIYEEDFMKTAMDYLLFEKGIDKKEFTNHVVNEALYSTN